MQDAGFRQAAIDAALDWGITLADLQGISVGELGEFLQSHRPGIEDGGTENAQCEIDVQDLCPQENLSKDCEGWQDGQDGVSDSLQF